jgi:hypothetical protein
MRKLVLTGIAVAGLAAATAGAASYFAPVPPKAQQQIKQRASLYAYMPARVPAGFRFVRWNYTAKPLPVIREFFRSKTHLTWEITFVASPQRGTCPRGEKSFQVDGNKVYWSHTLNEQQAWRCVTGSDNKLVRLTAATPIPATRFASSGLAQVAAAGLRIK